MTKKRKSIQTITDPLLEPFFITKDEFSYAVKEKVQSNADHFRSNGKGKSYEKSLYYFADLPRAINKIAELQAEKGNFDSLKSYIENYKSISNKIKNYTNGIRSTI